MAKKISIDLDPQGPLTFEREVSIPTPDGKPLKVSFTFKHRTREQMAQMQDSYMEKAREAYQRLQESANAEKQAQADAEAEGLIYMPPMQKSADAVEAAIRSDVETVMDCASGWGLTAEFNAENLTKFFRLYAKAGEKIAADYRVSMTEGRLGN